MTKGENDETVFAVQCKTLPYSKILELDTKNKLVYIESRVWGCYIDSQVHRFADIEKVVVNGSIEHDEDGIRQYIYTIKLVDQDFNTIWECELISDQKQYEDIASKLRSALKSTFEEKALQKYSVRCKNCKRVISKISKFCIYCGTKKAP